MFIFRVENNPMSAPNPGKSIFHILFRYVFPLALVVFFLACFTNDLLHYFPNGDDSFNAQTVAQSGIVKSIIIFYEGVNGRWFSHVITAVDFHFLDENHLYYGMYLAFVLMLFILSAANLIRAFKPGFSYTKAIQTALVFTACLFFLLYDGSAEVWAWVSSVNNHLLGVILFMVLLPILVSSMNDVIKTLLVLLLSAFIGGLNEVNAVCSTLAIGTWYFTENKKPFSKKLLILVIIGIGASLTINLLSGGYTSRMNSLPHFTIIQSLKNTAHTFLLPVLQYRYLPLRIGVLAVFLFYINPLWYKKTFDFLFIKKVVLLLCLVSVSFFLHCYILSDIVPPRGEIWAYTLVLFTLFIFYSNASPSAEHSEK